MRFKYNPLDLHAYATYCKFYGCKNQNFQMTNCDSFPKDVNGYSNIRIFVFVPNIRIRFLNSNIHIFFLSLRFLVIFFYFLVFFFFKVFKRKTIDSS